MNRTLLLAVSCAATAALALTACSSGDDSTDSSGDSVTITYTNFISNGGNEDNLTKIVDAFEAENPDIKVKVTTLAYADYFTALQTDLAAGTPSDVFDIEYANYEAYQDNGVLGTIAVANPGAYDTTLLETYQTDGTQYALPTSFSNVVLFYNKDLFDAASLEYPTRDWTWEDEQKAAEALVDADAGVFGNYQTISYNEFYKTLEQNGASFLNDDGTAVAFNTPAGIEAAEWLINKSGTTMPTEAEGAGTPDFDSNLFVDGKLGMLHSGIWMFGTFADSASAWDIEVEPGNTQPASAMFSNAVAVSATSENADAAAKWAEYLSGSDVAAQTRLDAGWELPPISDEALLASYLEMGAPDNRQAVFDSLEDVALSPALGADQAEIGDIVTALLGEAAAGRMSAADAVEEMETQVNAIIG
jgi:multiple sugar transport system substrate-binding protein